MNKTVRIFLKKLAKKSYFYTAKSSFSNIDGPVFFLLYDLECEISFLNYVNIQLILEFKKSILENIIQFVLKLFKGRFLGHPLDILYILYITDINIIPTVHP